MAVKIKLKRLGRTRVPTYRIVVADARTKRDGRAIEEIGKYHPKEEPSLIEVNSERAQHWLSVGAQPTEPVLTILKITGDWQKFRGEPGAEGTLRTREPAADKKERFADALKDAAKDEAAAPRGGSRARKPDAAKADAAKADTKADGAKASAAKPESGRAKSKASAETTAAGSADESAAAAATATATAGEPPAAEAQAGEPPAAEAPAAEAQAAEAQAGEPHPAAEPRLLRPRLPRPRLARPRLARRRRAVSRVTEPEVLEEALEHLVRGIVEHPDDVLVSSRAMRRGSVLEVRVHPDDLGKVIGRGGRTARALRTVMGSLAGGRHVRVDLLDTDEIR